MSKHIALTDAERAEWRADAQPGTFDGDRILRALEDLAATKQALAEAEAERDYWRARAEKSGRAAEPEPVIVPQQRAEAEQRYRLGRVR